MHLRCFWNDIESLHYIIKKSVKLYKDMKICVDFSNLNASLDLTKCIHVLHSSKIRVSSDCASFVIFRTVFLYLSGKIKLSNATPQKCPDRVM